MSSGSAGTVRYAEEIAVDTLTTRTQRIMDQTRRIRENLNELTARLVLDSQKGMLVGRGGDIPPPPQPSHSQMCLETAEGNLNAIEENLSSLLTRI